MTLKKPDVIPADICSCLMTKTMALNTEYRRTVYETTLTADTALYHCIVTMSNMGPDEDDVEPWKCRPGRSCHDCNEVDPT